MFSELIGLLSRYGLGWNALGDASAARIELKLIYQIMVFEAADV